MGIPFTNWRIYIMYGHAYYKRRRFARHYQATFPHRRHQNHKQFGAINGRLRGAGTTKPFAVNWRRDKSVQAPDVEEGVLDRGSEHDTCGD